MAARLGKQAPGSHQMFSMRHRLQLKNGRRRGRGGGVLFTPRCTHAENVEDQRRMKEGRVCFVRQGKHGRSWIGFGGYGVWVSWRLGLGIHLLCYLSTFITQFWIVRWSLIKINLAVARMAAALVGEKKMRIKILRQ